jgi:hypothetical protein
MIRLLMRHMRPHRDPCRRTPDPIARKQFLRKLGLKGTRAEAVYRAVENPNDITVTHEFATIEAAQAFAESADKEHGRGFFGGQSDLSGKHRTSPSLLRTHDRRIRRTIVPR